MNKYSRYRYVSRRQVLQGSAGAGLAALLAACGSSDAQVFATDSTTATTGSSSVATSTPTSETPGTAPGTTPAPSPVAGEVAISFAYAFGNGGKKLNPYIAVWIEDAEGNLLRTNALWFEQPQKGPRWLSDLKRWFVVDQASFGPDAIETVSSATRQPGSYTVSWDGLDAEANPVTAPVFICIEAARERGPYSLIREPYDFSAAGPVALGDDGELSNATVTSV